MNIFVQSRISSLMYSFTLFSKSLNMSFDSPSFFHWSNKDLFSGDLIVGYTLLSFATVKIFAIICLLYKIIDIVQIFLYTCGPMALWPCGLFAQWLLCNCGPVTVLLYQFRFFIYSNPFKFSTLSLINWSFMSLLHFN